MTPNTQSFRFFSDIVLRRKTFLPFRGNSINCNVERHVFHAHLFRLCLCLPFEIFKAFHNAAHDSNFVIDLIITWERRGVRGSRMGRLDRLTSFISFTPVKETSEAAIKCKLLAKRMRMSLVENRKGRPTFWPAVKKEEDNDNQKRGTSFSLIRRMCCHLSVSESRQDVGGIR